jgi:cysteine desulfurase / selenocysteine lyase
VSGYDVEALRAREFPWAASGETIYLNHASTGPLPQRSVDVVAEWGRLRANPQRLPQDLQFGTLARTRSLIAKLIGADAGEIALAANTSFGINLAAFSLPLERGDVIVTPDLEFPANIYPWMAAANRRGGEFRRVDLVDGVADTETILRALDDDRVRVLAVSWVSSANGARLDLGTLGAACRARGIYFVVDAIQGLGPLSLDLSRLPVDIFTSGAQKWLLSPWGAGFVYVRRELIAELEPHDVSWLGVRDSDDFTRLPEYDLTWRDDARKFEFITLPYQDFAATNASLALLHELGPANIAAHVERLADFIVRWAESHADLDLVTPSDRSRRGGIVSIRPRDASAASERLTAANVAHSLRQGMIRLSPYFYNTEEELERALPLLSE